MSEKSFLPWSSLMAFGLGELKLSSESFWAMSLREMDAAIAGCKGRAKCVAIPARTNIEEMMAKYPDEILENLDE